MQQRKRPTANIGISSVMGGFSKSPDIQYAMPPSATAANCRYGLRQYQPRPSKHKIKVSRYRLRGSTHRNGIAATFCDKWLVMERRSTEAHAGSNSQSE